MAGGNKRCGECHGTDLAVVSIRDVPRPPRKGEPAGADRPAAYRRVEYKCRRCGCDDFALQRLDAGPAAGG